MSDDFQDRPIEWEALVVHLNKWTDDRRMIRPEGFTWREEFSVAWKDHADEEIVAVGTRVELRGEEVWAFGHYAQSELANEFRQAVDREEAGWPSIELGENEEETEVIISESENGSSAEFQRVKMIGMAIVRSPAQEGTFFRKPTEAVTAAVSEKPWDGAASRFDDAQWKRATAACDGSDSPPKTACFLPHHEPDGAVSRSGVHAAAARFNQTERPNKDTAKRHLAAHYRNDLDEDVPSVLSSAVVAASPALAPRAWFENPGLKSPTPLTVTKEGRVFGHLAQWGICHTGIMHTCLHAPKGNDYRYFLTGIIETAEGDEIPVGQLTMGCGHENDLSAPAFAAKAHYDAGPGAVQMADVSIGEDEQGIWFAGALREGVSEEQIREFKANALSGDWRKIGGNLELIAAVSVVAPGYPIARVASGDRFALVAAGIVDSDPLEERLTRLEELTKPLALAAQVEELDRLVLDSAT